MLLTDLLTYSIQQSPSCEANQFSTCSRNSPPFMETDSSLPHSHVPATCPYPWTARSSSCPHIPPLEYPASYYFPIYAWVIQVVTSPQFSSPKPCIQLYSPPYLLHAPSNLILLDLITQKMLGEEFRSLNSSLCPFLYSSVTSSLLGPNILLNTLFSNTLNLRSSFNVSDQVLNPYKTM